jgi:hypothetical protein
MDDNDRMFGPPSIGGIVARSALRKHARLNDELGDDPVRVEQ